MNSARWFARPHGSRRLPGFREAALAVVALTLGVAPVIAQDVRLADRPQSDAQEALEAFLARGDYVLWTRDTVLARSDTVRASVLVLEGSARISGRIEGDVYVVDGDLFLRTRGSVGGDIVVLGGGFYDSDLAEVGGTITYRPNEPLRVRPTQGDFEIISEVEPLAAVELDGTRGLRGPAYDRVHALTFEVGGLFRAPEMSGRPELEAVARLRTAGPRQLGGTIRNSWYLSERLRFGLSATREATSNEAWIRPTWYNSLAHFVAGDDNRDHYESDRFGVELELVSPEPPVWEDASEWRVTLAGGWEDAMSLAGRDVTVLFDNEQVPFDGESPIPAGLFNAGIDDGSLFYGAAGFEWSKRGREGRLAFGVGLEAGFDDDIAGSSPGIDEDFNYLLFEGRVSARRITAWGHAVDVFGIGRADLSGTLPRQRWSTLGSIGTLPTIPLRALRGARMLYAEATYAVPILGMAALGGLEAFARGSVGGVGSDGGLTGGGVDFDLRGAVAGGLAVRLWEFQMEFGLATGSTLSPEDSDVTAFFDVRVRRSATPSMMPKRGRGF